MATYVIPNSGSNSGQSVFVTSQSGLSDAEARKAFNLSGTRAHVYGSAGGGSVSRVNNHPNGATKAEDALSSLSGMSSLDDYFKRLESITASNNLWSAEQAQKQMDFQKQSAKEAMQFNHDEALLSRDWQEYMSNTAHQREIKDLTAAGLNPVLSAMGGSGAPVTSGATASGYTSQGAKGDTDTSLAPALVSLLGSLMTSQSHLLSTITSAQSQERIAALGARTDMARTLTSAASAREVADIQGQTSRDVANIQGETSRVVARIGASANISAAQIHAKAQTAAASISGQYGLSIAQTNQLTGIITSSINTASNESIAKANQDLQRDMQRAGFGFDIQLQDNKATHDLELSLVNNGAGAVRDLIGNLTRVLPFALG